MNLENMNSEVKQTFVFFRAQLTTNMSRGRVIAFYNFKGGVAKTTQCINVSAALALEGAKVCIVDADPQANISAYFNSGNYEEFTAEQLDATCRGDISNKCQGSEVDEVEHRDAYPDCLGTDLSAYLCSNMLTIESVFHPLYEENKREKMEKLLERQISILNEGMNKEELDILNYSGITPAKLEKKRRLLRPRLFQPCNSSTFFDKDTNQPLLWLLPGKFTLAHLEIPIGNASNKSDHDKAATVLVGAPTYLINALRGCFDYVLVDLGPNFGALNKCIAMASDLIYPPAFLDSNSVEAMRDLFVRVFPEWYSWRQRTLKFQRSKEGYFYDLGGDEDSEEDEEGANQDFDLRPYLLDPDCPRILPMVCTGYDIDIHNRVCKHHSNFYGSMSAFMNAMMHLRDINPKDSSAEWFFKAIHHDKRTAKSLISKMDLVVDSFAPIFTRGKNRMVLLSTSRMHEVMPISQETGLTIMELDREVYFAQYPEEKADAQAEEDGPSKKKRKKCNLEYSDKWARDISMQNFEEEVDDGKKCWGSIARYIKREYPPMRVVA